MFPALLALLALPRAGYPDATAMNPESPYYDPKHNTENPRWYRVDVAFEHQFKRTISLTELREQTALLAMPLVRKGNRLSCGHARQ